MTSKASAKSQLKWRTVVSLTTTWMFLIMGLTGIVLYIVPQGRIAYWVDWHFWGLSKTDWGDIHIVTSVLFLIAGGWHLYFNWRAFLAHIRRKLVQGIRIRTELYATVLATALVTLSALWHIPPLGYLIDLNDAIKNHWIADKTDEPPFGHAELLSLKRLCQKSNINLSQAMAELTRNTIQALCHSTTPRRDICTTAFHID